MNLTKVTAAAVVVIGSASALAADCGNFFGQRCLVDLPTGVHMSYYELGPNNGEPLILLLIIIKY